MSHSALTMKNYDDSIVGNSLQEKQSSIILLLPVNSSSITRIFSVRKERQLYIPVFFFYHVLSFIFCSFVCSSNCLTFFSGILKVLGNFLSQLQVRDKDKKFLTFLQFSRFFLPIPILFFRKYTRRNDFEKINLI
jgi:hypothetical protein